jgi:hypothetical protein
MDILNTLVGGLAGGLAPNLLGGALKTQTGQVGTATQRPFKSHLVIADGDTAYDTAAEVIALKGTVGAGYFKIWQKTIAAQEAIRWGFGSPVYPHNQGYMWFVLVDSGTGFDEGMVRLKQANARETKVFTVAELDDTRLHGATNTSVAAARPTNINEMIALPEKVEFPKVGEDSLLQIYYSLITATTTVDAAGWSIPCSIYQ